MARSDITLMGGARGGGKTFGALMRPLFRQDAHVANLPLGALEDPLFTGLILRRRREDLIGPGKLWETAKQFYAPMEPRIDNVKLEMKFPSGAHIKFAGVQHETDTEKYRGGAFTWILLEEGTQFTKEQFLDLMRCNRPHMGCKVKPWMDITANPDECWLLELVDWYLLPEPKPGTPDPDKACRQRHVAYHDDKFSHVDESWRDPEGNEPQTFCFVPSTVDDNPALLEVDPGYASKLHAQSYVQVQRDRWGDWRAASVGGFFGSVRLRWMPRATYDVRKLAAWDLAATKRERPEGRNATSGVLVASIVCDVCHGWRYVGPDDPCECNQDGAGRAIVGPVEDPETALILLDATVQEVGPRELQDLMRAKADEWGAVVPHYVEEETAASGKITTATISDVWLRGFQVYGDKPSGTKLVRAGELQRLGERGLLWVVADPSFQLEVNRSLRDFPGGGRDLIDAWSAGELALRSHNWGDGFFFESLH
jgi:hypothetical protein